jgi:hypothetical protein
MKRVGAIMMALSVLALMFGCGKQQKWNSLTYHVVSSVQAEGCHFTVSRTADGGMTISGFCFDGETEYRVDEAKPLSSQAADYIDGLALKKARPSITGGSQMVDGVYVTVKASYPDGSESKIDLDRQTRTALLRQLKTELIGQ